MNANVRHYKAVIRNAVLYEGETIRSRITGEGREEILSRILGPKSGDGKIENEGEGMNCA